MLFFMIYMFFLCGTAFSDMLKHKYDFYGPTGKRVDNLIKPSKTVLKRVDKMTKADGRDKKGWINLNTLTENDLRYINVELRHGKVMCNEGKRVVPIKVKGVENASGAGENNFYLLHVDYGFISPDSKTVNPLPVVKKGWDSSCDWGVDFGFPKGVNGNTHDKIFGDNFEGYLVCYRKDEQALLVPKNFKGVNFKEPQWKVAVHIDIYRNPLAPFGRQYKVTILDSVEVLENGKKSFIWPIPLGSMVDVYIFHKMLEKRRNKMCFLERDAKTFDVNLYCENWGIKLKRKNINIAALIALGLYNAGILAYSSTVNPNNVEYELTRIDNVDDDNSVTNNDGASDGNKGLTDGQGIDDILLESKVKQSALSLAKFNWFALVNTVGLLLWGSVMAAWSTGLYLRLLWDIRQMDKVLEKINFVYPWALQRPGYTKEVSHLKKPSE